MPQQREESSTKIPVNSSFVAKPVKCPRAKINWAITSSLMISRRGIHPQAVAIACARNLFPSADRHRMPEQPAEPSHVELDFLELTSPVGSRAFCQRCHCCERARH